MNSTSDTLEPKTAWDQQTESYNTEHSRHKLHQFPGHPHAQPTIVMGNHPILRREVFLLGTVLDTFVRPLADNTTFDPVIVLPRTGLDKLAVHPTHTDLFQDTLILTGSLGHPGPVCSSAPDEILRAFGQVEKSGHSRVSFSLTATIPVQWIGFMLGTALIATHLFVLAVVLVEFVRSTEMSFLGCYWQTVAQLVSDETQSILKEADRMDDKAVKDWIEREDFPDSLGGRWILRGSSRKRITQDDSLFRVGREA